MTAQTLAATREHISEADSGAVELPDHNHWQGQARHHLSILLDNPGTEFFTLQGKGCVGYSRYKNTVVCLGGLMAAPPHRHDLLQEFLRWCAAERLQPLFLHFPETDIPLLNTAGCKVNQVGACYSINLQDYTMAGKRFQQLRYKINKAKKRGIHVEEISSQSDFLNIKPTLKAINQSWQKGKKAKPIRIMVTDFDSINLSANKHRLMVAYHNNELISYILYSRIIGPEPGWFHNLSRHKMGSIDGSMQIINKTFLDSLEPSEQYLHFGFTPLVEMGQELGNGSGGFTKIANLLSRHGGVVYPARSQRQYKCSWRPSLIRPEYFAYRCGPLSALFKLLVATNSI